MISILTSSLITWLIASAHAINALPQLATAGVNCRILPGEPVEGVQAQIERALADKRIEVKGGKATLSPPSPLNEEIMGSIEKLSKEFWPDAAVVPVMSTGATDGHQNDREQEEEGIDALRIQI
jgi:acetylornithine deacetylase/succinyl-diaminopimelate desuccinylase-like protein